MHTIFGNSNWNERKKKTGIEWNRPSGGMEVKEIYKRSQNQRKDQ